MWCIANNERTGIPSPARYAENTDTIAVPARPQPTPGAAGSRSRPGALAGGERRGQDIRVPIFTDFFIGSAGAAGAHMLAVRVRSATAPGPPGRERTEGPGS